MYQGKNAYPFTGKSLLSITKSRLNARCLSILENLKRNKHNSDVNKHVCDIHQQHYVQWLIESSTSVSLISLELFR